MDADFGSWFWIVHHSTFCFLLELCTLLVFTMLCAETAADAFLVGTQSRSMCWTRARSSSSELVETTTAVVRGLPRISRPCPRQDNHRAKQLVPALWLPNSYFKSRALQRLSVKVFFLQVWVVLTDAEETSGTGTDTRSSWLPKRCRFGASPSVIAKFSTHDRPPTKSVTALPILCVHVRGK